ncbi:MAG: SDR family oxidoreductase [Alphaproteobacteria bacterium]|nr:SDR family oxidoreductase [Alphaproteobacteria bacterium]
MVHNVTINNLLSGAFDSERLHANMAAVAAKTGADMEEFTRQRAASIPAGRFGTPEEFGHACALLCSAHSGYITGQNLLPDGGACPGTMWGAATRCGTTAGPYRFRRNRLQEGPESSL